MSRDPEEGVPTAPITLQKYVYAASDPVNTTDPTGRAPVAEEVEVTVKIDLGALPAVWVAGCSVSVAYNALALKLRGAEDVTPTANCEAKGLSRMKLQLQKGSPKKGGKTIGEATRTMVARDPPGVSLRRVYLELDELRDEVKGGLPGFPRSAQRGLDSAIDQVKSCAARYPPLGIAIPQQNFCKGYFTSDTNDWRIDLDNDAGWNLRQ